jgi:AcrR family transcriptional regulator
MGIRMKSDERRAAIVRSAIHLFAEKGFRGATTRELAGVVGVTEPVLYQHFRTKKELYSAILEECAAAAQPQAAEFYELAGADDDRGFFVALGNLILSRYEKDPELLRLLLFSSLERHELSDLFFDRMVANFFQTVSGYIRRRIRSGAFRKVQPDIAARTLIGMFSYHGLIHLLYPDKIRKPSRKQLVNETVALFLGGIAAPVQTQ